MVLGTKHIMTTDCYHQTNSKPERLTKTLIVRLRYYRAEHQRNWDIYVQRLKCANNMQVYRSKSLLAFSLSRSWQAPGPQHSIVGWLCPLKLQGIHLPMVSSTAATSDINNAAKCGQSNEATYCRYKGDHEKRVRNATKNIEVAQYEYPDRPLIKIFASDCLETESYSKQLSFKMDRLS